jgi:SAM-dependent methyltransferase
MQGKDRVRGPLGRLVAARRRSRYRSLLAGVRTWDGMSVLDLGCGRNGRSTTDYAPRSWRITGLDRLPTAAVKHRHPGFQYVRGTACDLSAYGDDEFDLVLAVGLLEHVVDAEDFRRAAAEIQRVAPQYALVVPYRYAWLEPHYLVPFFPVLPQGVQNALVRLFDLKGQRAAVAADPGFVGRRTVWRRNADYRAAFPGATVRLAPTLETVLISKGATVGAGEPVTTP